MGDWLAVIGGWNGLRRVKGGEKFDSELVSMLDGKGFSFVFEFELTPVSKLSLECFL